MRGSKISNEGTITTMSNLKKLATISAIAAVAIASTIWLYGPAEAQGYGACVSWCRRTYMENFSAVQDCIRNICRR
jgi:hypothetical protein